MTKLMIDGDDWADARRCIALADRAKEGEISAVEFASLMFGMDPVDARNMLLAGWASTPPGTYEDDGAIRLEAEALRRRALYAPSPIPTAAELSRPGSAVSRIEAAFMYIEGRYGHRGEIGR